MMPGCGKIALAGSAGLPSGVSKGRVGVSAPARSACTLVSTLNFFHSIGKYKTAFCLRIDL